MEHAARAPFIDPEVQRAEVEAVVASYGGEEYFLTNYGLGMAELGQQVGYDTHIGPFIDALVPRNPADLDTIKCPVGGRIKAAFKEGGVPAVQKKLEALKDFDERCDVSYSLETIAAVELDVKKNSSLPLKATLKTEKAPQQGEKSVIKDEEHAKRLAAQQVSPASSQSRTSTISEQVKDKLTRELHTLLPTVSSSLDTVKQSVNPKKQEQANADPVRKGKKARAFQPKAQRPAQIKTQPILPIPVIMPTVEKLHKHFAPPGVIALPLEVAIHTGPHLSPGPLEPYEASQGPLVALDESVILSNHETTVIPISDIVEMPALSTFELATEFAFTKVEDVLGLLGLAPSSDVEELVSDPGDAIALPAVVLTEEAKSWPETHYEAVTTEQATMPVSVAVQLYKPEVQEQIAALVETTSPEVVVAIEASLQVMVQVATRLHIITIENPFESLEVAEIKKYIHKLYAQLEELGVDFADTSVEELLAYICSDLYIAPELEEQVSIDENKGTHEQKIGVFALAHRFPQALSQRFHTGLLAAYVLSLAIA